MTSSVRANQDALMSDMQDALADTEALLESVAAEGGDMADSMRARITANLEGVKAKLRETEALISQKAKAAAKATDGYVHENPWQSIGVAAAVGFLVGLLVSRR